MTTQNLREYYSKIANGSRVSPRDPFALSHSLLLPDDNNILKGDLADKQAMLSYIGDDMMVQFYQQDVDILTRMRNMGMRDDNLLPVFATIYDGWIGTLKMTRAKDGMERYLQANAVGGYSPTSAQITGGYGEQFASDARRAEEAKAKNNPIKTLMAGFLGRKQQQQQR